MLRLRKQSNTAKIFGILKICATQWKRLVISPKCWASKAKISGTGPVAFRSERLTLKEGPLLNTVKAVKFIKVSTELHFKFHLSKTEFEPCSFLKPKLIDDLEHISMEE